MNLFNWFLNNTDKDRKAVLGTPASLRNDRLDKKRYPVGNSFYHPDNRKKILDTVSAQHGTQLNIVDESQIQKIMEHAYFQHINEEKYVVNSPAELGDLLATLNETCVAGINDLIARNKKRKAISDDILRRPRASLQPRQSIESYDQIKDSEFISTYNH